MPRKPQWFQHLPQIVEDLSALDVPVVDRALIERLFGLGRRAAINLLARFGGYQVGKTYLVDRRLLLKQLRRVQRTEDYHFEAQRRQSLVATLDKLQKQRAGAQVSIPVKPDVFSRQLADLPEGVRIEPGQLTITFTSAENLLSRLFELAQGISNDFRRFQEIVEPKQDLT